MNSFIFSCSSFFVVPVGSDTLCRGELRSPRFMMNSNIQILETGYPTPAEDGARKWLAAASKSSLRAIRGQACKMKTGSQALQ